MTFGECMICHRWRELDPHHLLPGNKRKQADEDSIVWDICRECHINLHSSPDKEWRNKFRELQQEGELMWLRKTGGTIEQFCHRYGKNFLDEEDEVNGDVQQDPIND